MKNLTKGNLVLIIMALAYISNVVAYFCLHGNPYDTPLNEADGWTTFTGVSLGVVGLLSFVFAMIYIIENWEKKL